MSPIPPSFLPPRALWPERIYTLPEHAAYPQRLNSTEELIDRHVEAGQGDRVAILYEDQRITYRQLQGSVARLAAALRDLGLGEEDRVLLRSPSIPPALVANFAVIRIGGVIVPTSPLFSRAELVHVAEDTEAIALIVAAPLLDEVEQARGDLRRIRHVIVIGGDAAEIKAKGYIPYGELLATARSTVRARPPRPPGRLGAPLHLGHHRAPQGHRPLHGRGAHRAGRLRPVRLARRSRRRDRRPRARSRWRLATRRRPSSRSASARPPRSCRASRRRRCSSRSRSTASRSCRSCRPPTGR